MNTGSNTISDPTVLYEEPVRGVDPDECLFYHRMVLPGIGSVGTQWDIQCDCDNYLGGIDFSGKRVLDVGTASGYLTFEMESRGAEVVSFDMVDASQWDIVPRVRIQENQEQLLQNRRRTHRRLRNAYWYAHEKLDSHAKVFLGNIYDLPLELGEFDIVFFGMILGHLQNPFQALYSASRLCRSNIVIANQTLPTKWRNRKIPMAQFMPAADNNRIDCWWALSDLCVSNMLDVLGFQTEKRMTSKPQCIVDNRQGVEVCTTTVTQRYAGSTHVNSGKAA